MIKAVRKNKIMKIIAIAVLSVVAICVIGGIIYNAEVIIPGKYLRAEQLLSQDLNAEAYNIFKTLGSFKDSQEKSEKLALSFYSEATAKYNSGDFAGAQNIFEILGQYKEAYEYSIWCAAQRNWNGEKSVEYDLTKIEAFALKKISGDWVSREIVPTYLKIEGSTIEYTEFKTSNLKFNLKVKKHYIAYNYIGQGENPISYEFEIWIVSDDEFLHSGYNTVVRMQPNT